jgi:hypothetical protein
MTSWNEELCKVIHKLCTDQDIGTEIMELKYRMMGLKEAFIENLRGHWYTKIPEQIACLFLLAPLFPYDVHYIPYNVHCFPTCSTFSPQRGRIFIDMFLTHLRLQPS